MLQRPYRGGSDVGQKLALTSMCTHRDFGRLFLVRNLRWSFLLAVVGLTILADVRAHARAWTIETIPTLHSIQSIQQTEQSEQDWIAAGTPFSLIAASPFVGKVVAAAG